MDNQETPATNEQPESVPVEAIVKPLVPMSLCKLFGPARCEKPGCRADSWTIWMSQAEYDAAKSQKDFHSLSYVFRYRIGIALCERHSPESV